MATGILTLRGTSTTLVIVHTVITSLTNEDRKLTLTFFPRGPVSSTGPSRTNRTIIGRTCLEVPW